MDRYKNKYKYLTWGFILCVIIFSLSSMYMFYKSVTGKALVDKRYEASFYSHAGAKISGLDGPLRLGMSPWTIYKNYPNQKTIHFTINSLGFRGRELAKKNENQLRVIVVGGSGAFGTGVENDTETFEEIMENSGRAYQVINAGVAGFVSGQELAYVVSELVDLAPDIVIVYDGWNDLFDALHRSSGRKIIKELGFSKTFLKIEDQLVKSNAKSLKSIFRDLCLRLDNKLHDRTHKKVIPEPCGSVDDKEYFQSIVTAYTSNLIKMRDFLSSRNIILLVVIQPEAGQKINRTKEEEATLDEVRIYWGFKDYKGYFSPLYHSLVTQAKEILAINQIDVIDINAYEKFINNRGKLFIDVVHTNKEGNEIIAQIIKDHLDNMKPK